MSVLLTDFGMGVDKIPNLMHKRAFSFSLVSRRCTAVGDREAGAVCQCLPR